jgi:rubrerythrin
MRRQSSNLTSEANAAHAFADQRRAHATYDLMSRAAEKEGLHFAAAVFKESARQELTHAETLMRFFGKGALQAEVSVAPVEGTMENIRAAAEGELEDAKSYAEFAESALIENLRLAAQENGEPLVRLAGIFAAFESAERYHRARFLALERVLLTERSRDGWRCLNCGFYTSQVNLPPACPGCGASGYFVPLNFEALVVEGLRGSAAR